MARAYNKKLKKLRRENRRLFEEKRDLRGENDHLRRDHAHSARLVTSARTELNEVKRSKDGLQDQTAFLIRRQRELEQDLAKAKSVREELVKQQTAMTSKSQRDQDSIRRLQEQVKRYKANISAATQPNSALADDTIRNKVDTLFRDIQAFVVRTFRHGNFDFAILPEQWKIWANEHVPCANSLAKEYWYNMCIAIISSVLCEYWGARHYFGTAPRQPLKAAALLAARLQSTNDAKFKSWLEATRELIVLGQPDLLRESEAYLKQDMVLSVENSIVQAMQVEWNNSKREELANILGSGMELFRLLHQQPAVFSVQMIHAVLEGEEQLLVPDHMQDVENLEDAATLAGRRVEISVFPVVYKTGDGIGGKPYMTTVVSKARVVPGKATPYLEAIPYAVYEEAQVIDDFPSQTFQF